MALSAKSIISLLNIRGIGRTAVLCYAKYAEHLGVSVISPKDYLDVISECHDKEGCRVKVEGVSLNDIYAAEYNADKIIEECEKFFLK